MMGKTEELRNRPNLMENELLLTPNGDYVRHLGCRSPGEYRGIYAKIKCYIDESPAKKIPFCPICHRRVGRKGRKIILRHSFSISVWDEDRDCRVVLYRVPHQDAVDEDCGCQSCILAMVENHEL